MQLLARSRRYLGLYLALSVGLAACGGTEHTGETDAGSHLLTVSASGDSHETIAPSDPQTVMSGATQAFTVTAMTGYTVSMTVGGTCPTGTWSGSSYTTGAITASCSVAFTATLNTYQVTASGDGNETIAPSTAQTVNSGATQAFTVTAMTGYTLSMSVTGTCPTGTWSGSSYTTGAITASCSVSFAATLNTYQVTASGDGNENIAPSTAQTVNYGATQAFTVAAMTGYTLSMSVTGTCPTGTWSGSSYTTGAITASCSVSFAATLNTYQVTASGDGNENIAPSTAQTVNYGATQAFTVTAMTGYTVSMTVGGTCPAGSWSGSSYTTGAITASCSVSFAVTLNMYQVTASGDGNESINPMGAQTVGYGATQAYTVTANVGHNLSTTVGGTCPAGKWSGDQYTTGPIVGACTVTFSAPPMCSNPATDCPSSPSACLIPACAPSGACTLTNAPARSACNDNSGAVCNGSGTCVPCVQASDCPVVTCMTTTCDSNACVNTNAAAGTACAASCSNDGASTNACDGMGNCASNAVTDCGTYGCAAGACTSPCPAGNCAGVCTGLCLQQVACTSATTTLSGTVHAPNGTTPVPNVTVYIPNGGPAPSYGVQPFAAGVSCDACSAGGEITGAPLVSTTTAVDGTFTLTNVPVGSSIPLVMQIGRWRRQVMTVVANACGSNAVPASLTHLPTTHTEGDIPLIAIVTGSVDAVECGLRKVGIADSEFSDPSGSGRVRLYQGAGDPGATYSASTPSETTLWGTQAAINQYDMVMFACQGDQYDQSAAAQQILINYANAGGRLFTTHYEYTWLYNDTPFSETATWNVNQAADFSEDPGTGLINETFSEGLQLAQWLEVTGASDILGQVPIGTLRNDFTGVTAPSDLWLTVNDPTQGQNIPMLYSFDTPVGSAPANQCGRVMFNDFHIEDAMPTGKFPSECTALGTSTSPEEQLLHYLLFDLTNCVSPGATPSAVVDLDVTRYLVSVTRAPSLTESPSGPQLVPTGGNATYTIAPSTGAAVSPTVGGTCPAGSWAGDTYTTGAITQDCSVVFTAVTPQLQPVTWTEPSLPTGATASAQALTGPFDSETFSYALSGTSVYTPKTFTFQATAASTETLDFDWSYTGFHAYFEATAALTAFANGPSGMTSVTLVPTTKVDGNFTFSGTASLPVTAGDTFGIAAVGVNEDSNDTLNGTITLTAQ